MDTDTLIILMMLTAAFCWWLMLQFLESKKLAEENKRQMKNQLMRAERIKRLLNKQ
jgi:hypothetical protein